MVASTMKSKTLTMKRTSTSTKRKCSENNLSTCSSDTPNNLNHTKTRPEAISDNCTKPRHKRRRRLADSSSTEDHNKQISGDIVQPSLSSGPSSAELLPHAHKCSTLDPCKEISFQTNDQKEKPVNSPHIDVQPNFTGNPTRESEALKNVSSTKKIHCDLVNNNQSIERLKCDSTKDKTLSGTFYDNEKSNTLITSNMPDEHKLSCATKGKVNSQDLDDSKTQSIDLTEEHNKERVNTRKNHNFNSLRRTSELEDDSLNSTPPKINDKEKLKKLWASFESPNQDHRMFSNLAFSSSERKQSKSKLTPKKLTDSLSKEGSNIKQVKHPSNKEYEEKTEALQNTRNIENVNNLTIKTNEAKTNILLNQDNVEQVNNLTSETNQIKSFNQTKIQETKHIDVSLSFKRSKKGKLEESSKIDDVMIIGDEDGEVLKDEDEIKSNVHIQCHEKQQQQQPSQNNSFQQNDSVVSKEQRRHQRFGSHSEESIIPPTPPPKRPKFTKTNLSTTTSHKTFCYPVNEKGSIDTISCSKLDPFNIEDKIPNNKKDTCDVDFVLKADDEVATRCNKKDLTPAGNTVNPINIEDKLTIDGKKLKLYAFENELAITDSDKQLSEMKEENITHCKNIGNTDNIGIECNWEEDDEMNDLFKKSGDLKNLEVKIRDMKNPDVNIRGMKNLEKEQSDPLELGDFDDDHIDVYTNDKISERNFEEKTIRNLDEEDMKCSSVDDILFVEPPVKQPERMTSSRTPEKRIKTPPEHTSSPIDLHHNEDVDFTAERSCIGEVLDLSTIPTILKSSLQPMAHNKSTILPPRPDSFVDLDLFEEEPSNTNCKKKNTSETLSKSKTDNIDDIHLTRMDEGDIVEKTSSKNKHLLKSKRTIEISDDKENNREAVNTPLSKSSKHEVQNEEKPRNKNSTNKEMLTITYDDGGFSSNSDSSDDEMYMKPALSLSKQPMDKKVNGTSNNKPLKGEINNFSVSCDVLFYSEKFLSSHNVSTLIAWSGQKGRGLAEFNVKIESNLFEKGFSLSLEFKGLSNVLQKRKKKFS